MRTEKLKARAALLDRENRVRKNRAVLPPAHRWGNRNALEEAWPGKVHRFQQVWCPKEGAEGNVKEGLLLGQSLRIWGPQRLSIWNILSSAQRDLRDRWVKEVGPLCQG